jgi:hypothetical protein
MFCQEMVVVSETGSKTAEICCACRLLGFVSAAVETGVNGTSINIMSKTMITAFGWRLRFSAFAPITQYVTAAR